MFKVNKNSRTTSVTISVSVSIFTISIVDFEKVNVSW